MPVDAKTLRTQNQAEEVYERTDYGRAFFIYRNELAPIGDKYGQYMVGFMYLTGKGVEEDRVAASAWYRLAAERGAKEFVRVSDQLMRSLNEAQLAESDLLFVELRKEFGDLALLVEAIRQDYDKLRERTGSRLGGGGSSVTTIQLGSGASDADYYGRIERRIKARLEYIARYAEVGIADLEVDDVDSVDIDEIERLVTAYLNRLD